MKYSRCSLNWPHPWARPHIMDPPSPAIPACLLLLPPEASAKLLPSSIVQIRESQNGWDWKGLQRSSHSKPLVMGRDAKVSPSKSQDHTPPLEQGYSCGMWLVLAGAGALFSWKVRLGAELCMWNCRAVSTMIKIAMCRVLSQPLLQLSPSQALHMDSPGQPHTRRTPPAT